jgi:hypothetical protein
MFCGTFVARRTCHTPSCPIPKKAQAKRKIFSAIENNDHKRLHERLFKNPTSIFHKDPHTGNTPLHYASGTDCSELYAKRLRKECSPEILKLALAYLGDNPDLLNKHGETPLSLSCKTYFVAYSHLLLKKGANPNHVPQKGAPPLHAALTSFTFDAKFPIEEALLDKGANINLLDQMGQSPLFYLMLRNDFPPDILAKKVKWLLINGAQVDDILMQCEKNIFYLSPEAQGAVLPLLREYHPDL